MVRHVSTRSFWRCLTSRHCSNVINHARSHSTLNVSTIRHGTTATTLTTTILHTTASTLITSSTHNTSASTHGATSGSHCHVTLEMILGGPAHQISHKRLRNAGVHRVHGHVVAIVRRPAERKLRKITGTHHDTVFLVGHIHKNLRSFACL